MLEYFEESIQKELGYYVYMLLDTSNQPFYVGKGINNRVFDHLAFALKDEDSVRAKYDIIKEIHKQGNKVNHIIVKHGLESEHEAFLVESVLIDTLRFLKFPLTNLVSGHNALETGLMHADAIRSLYKAESLNSITNECVIININRKYDRKLMSNAIYEATKGIWAINKDQLIDPKTNEILRKYVLSEYHGRIVEVFEVLQWYQEEREFNKGSKRAGDKRMGMAFQGHPAKDEIRKLYRFKSISHHKKRGSATAHRFHLEPLF